MVDSKNLHWIGSVPLGSSIAAVGILGNFISVVVWGRLIKGKLKDNKSTGVYLITLALLDTGVLVFFLLADTIKADNSQLPHDYTYASFFAWFGFPMFFFFVVSSIWMVVGVTVNRYLMIQFPTKVRRIYAGWRTYASIGLLLGFCFIINIPHFFNFHVPQRNGTYNLELTEYGKTKGSEIYEFWVHCIFLVLAPWLSIAVMNGLIICKISKQMKRFGDTTSTKTTEEKSDKTSKKSRREWEMTMTLLSVTFTFLLFLLWQCVTQCFYMLGYHKDEQSTTMSWHYVDSSFAFAKLGVVFNSSINWVLYCISGSTFRKEMWRCFQRVIRDRSLGSLTNFSTQRSNLSSTPKSTSSELGYNNEAVV